MIFGRKGVVFRYYHTDDEMAPAGEFSIDFKELKRMEVEFVERMHNLKRYYVPDAVMFPLLCKALEISIKPAELKNKKHKERVVEFRNSVIVLTKKYFEDLGPNGYAALNVITDFASRPTIYISQESMIDPLQKRSGDWVETFLQLIEDKGFSFDSYLQEERGMADALSASLN